MKVVSKEDIIKLFAENKYKRVSVLYNYYKDDFFGKGFSAEYIASKISQDLGIEIDARLIYNINLRFVKDNKSNKEEKIASPIPPAEVPKKVVKAEVKKEPAKQTPQKPKDDFVFKNADEESKKGHFDNLDF